MRGSTVVFLAGAAAMISGAVAPAFSAEDRARVVPAPAAESAADSSSGDRPPVDTVEADRADGGEAEGGLARPTLEPALDERSVDASRDTKTRGGGGKQPLADASVTMKNIQFRPKTLRISPGDRVTWTNKDTAQHNAVDQGEFSTPLLSKGEDASVTIDSAGTYNYVCTVHAGMKGKLIAGSSGGGGSSSGSGSTGGSSGSSSGGTDSSTGSSGSSTFPSSGSSSSSSGGSSGSLPNTGQDQLPLLVLGAGLIVFGLLARAFHEFWIWR